MNVHSRIPAFFLVCLLLCSFASPAARGGEIELEYNLDNADIIINRGNADPIQLRHTAVLRWGLLPVAEVEQDGNKAVISWKNENSEQARVTSLAEVQKNNIRFENQWETEGIEDEVPGGVTFFIGMQVDTLEFPDLTFAFNGDVLYDFSEFRGLTPEQITEELNPRRHEIRAQIAACTELRVGGVTDATLTFTFDSPIYFDFHFGKDDQATILYFRVSYARSVDASGLTTRSGTAAWSLQID